MRIRVVRVDEGARLRALWLRALTDAPAALGGTPAQVAAYPAALWHARARPTADRISLIAETTLADVTAPGGWCGMVTGTRVETPADLPVVVSLTALWVDPAQRGVGLGGLLVQAVIAWARARGAACVTLAVAEGNVPAIALYRAAGFRDVGADDGAPAPPGQAMLSMTRLLAEGDSETADHG